VAASVVVSVAILEVFLVVWGEKKKGERKKKKKEADSPLFSLVL